MDLTPQGYLPRLADKTLATLVKAFGAVQVNGPKWCGKTWTCRTVAQSETRLDNAEMRTLVQADPRLALRGERPHLVDEWQLVPQVRDAVRRAVDDSGSAPGSFLLTGSSDPSRESYAHSGAGRIGRLHMRPMSLFETGASDGSVALSRLFEGDDVEFQDVDCDLVGLARLICRGGWPGSLQLEDDAALEVPPAYLNEVLDDNLTHWGLSSEIGRRVVHQMARSEGQPLKTTTVARAIGGASGDGAYSENDRKLAVRYLDALERLYVIEPLYGWAAPFKSRKRLRVNPKRYFCDPSLTAAALGVSPERLLSDGQLFGMLFESLCMRDLRIYAESECGRRRPSIYYYRDESGLEADAVLERADGSWGAVEVKLGENAVRDAEKSLLRLKAEATSNAATRVPDPRFLVVLVGSSSYMGTLPSGVTVVPISKLGA